MLKSPLTTLTPALDASAAIARSMASLEQAMASLESLLPTTAITAHGPIHQQIWRCRKALGKADYFFSQSGQDAWLEKNVFRGKERGVFAEIGAFDGIGGSNCAYFEIARKWSGVLVEPVPILSERASANRRSPCERVAICDRDEPAVELLAIERGLIMMSGLVETYAATTQAQVDGRADTTKRVIKVPAMTLATLFDKHGLSEIDYVSVDIEGAERAALTAFPFHRFRVTAWTIENNHRESAIRDLMQANGYRLADVVGVDDVFVLAR